LLYSTHLNPKTQIKHMKTLIAKTTRYFALKLITSSKVKNTGVGLLLADTLVRYFGPGSKRG
jgi:RNase P/RNase MRP subunit POP5